jgi:hypothetical protein
VTGEKVVLSTPTGSKTKGKGKVVEKSPELKEIPKTGVPLKRSSMRNLQYQEENLENI